MGKVKLSDLPLLTNPPEGATLVAVHNGTPVRFPKNAVGGGTAEIGDTIEVNKINFSYDGASTYTSITRENDRLGIVSGDSLYLSSAHAGSIMMYEPEETIFIEGDTKSVIQTYKGVGETRIEVEDDGEYGNIVLQSKNVIGAYAKTSIEFSAGENDETAIYASPYVLELRSPTIGITGVRNIDTINEGSGQAGQVLMSNGSTVYWADAPSGSGGSPMTYVTYAELKAFRDGGNLIPGMFYRITDYVCTTSQADTQATDHRFDIIVQALSNNKLSETAKADFNSEDSYFEDNNANLSAWEIKYCLDNDTTRFAWAKSGAYWVLTDCAGVVYILDEKVTVGGQEFFKTTSEMVLSSIAEPTTIQELYYYDGDEAITFEEDGDSVEDYGKGEAGKGVIYYMKDERNNELPYDFKNILYLKDTETYVYTFSNGVNDASFDASTHSNIVKPYFLGAVQYLNNNTFGESCALNTFANDCRNNTFGNGCWNNTFGYITIFNTFGDDCTRNTFSKVCSHNTFGNECCDNTFDDSCINNTFGNYSASNHFALSCKSTQVNGMGNFYACNIENKTLSHNDSFVSEI